MCVEATIDGNDYGLVRELAAVMPNGLVPEPIYVRQATERGETFTPDPNACLCQIDLRATAALNGYKAEMDESFLWMEFTRIEDR